MLRGRPRHLRRLCPLAGATVLQPGTHRAGIPQRVSSLRTGISLALGWGLGPSQGGKPHQDVWGFLQGRMAAAKTTNPLAEGLYGGLSGLPRRPGV